MSRFCLVLAAAGLLAASAAAQQPATGTTTATPVVTSIPSAPITYAYGPIESRSYATTSSTPARRGLFARLRARMSGTTTSSPVYSPAPAYSSPIITAPTTAPATAPPPSAPMQMPGKMSMTMPAGTQTVVVSGMAYQVPDPLPPEGVVVSERVITPMSEIMPASATQNLTFYYSNPSGMMMPASGTMMMPGSGTIITTGGPVQMMPGAVVPATYTTPATRTTTRPRR